MATKKAAKKKPAAKKAVKKTAKKAAAKKTVKKAAKKKPAAKKAAKKVAKKPAAKKAAKKKAAKKAKVAVRTADGKVVDVKQSELDSIRLARAREMEAQLYAYEGEQEIEETPVQKKKK